MGKQHFGCKIKMSVRFGRPAKLLARTAMMVVVGGKQFSKFHLKLNANFS